MCYWVLSTRVRFPPGTSKGRGGMGKEKKKKRKERGKELFPLRVPIFAQRARARKHEGKTREIRRSFRVADTQREFLFFELVHFIRSCYTMRIFFFFLPFSFLPFFFGNLLRNCFLSTFVSLFFVERAFIWQLLRCKSNFNNDTLKLYASVAGFLLDLVNRFWFGTCSYG